MLMIDVIGIIMITTYMTILAIPLLFNHTKIKASTRKRVVENKTNSGTKSKSIQPRSNGIIVFMGEIDDKKINEIMRILSNK